MFNCSLETTPEALPVARLHHFTKWLELMDLAHQIDANSLGEFPKSGIVLSEENYRALRDQYIIHSNQERLTSASRAIRVNRVFENIEREDFILKPSIQDLFTAYYSVSRYGIDIGTVLSFRSKLSFDSEMSSLQDELDSFIVAYLDVLRGEILDGFQATRSIVIQSPFLGKNYYEDLYGSESLFERDLHPSCLFAFKAISKWCKLPGETQISLNTVGKDDFCRTRAVGEHCSPNLSRIPDGITCSPQLTTLLSNLSCGRDYLELVSFSEWLRANSYAEYLPRCNMYTNATSALTLPVGIYRDYLLEKFEQTVNERQQDYAS